MKSLALSPSSSYDNVKVLFVASEVTPTIKTGGLADVVAALPAALVRQGIDARVAIPAYPSQLPSLITPPIFQATFQAGQQVVTSQVFQITFDTSIPLYLVHTHPGLASTDLYPLDPTVEQDRFPLFNVAVLAWLNQANWQPDIIHGHDWMAGVLIDQVKRQNLPYRTILTIHNAKYQGEVPAHWLTNLGLSYPEINSKINLLEMGVKSADQVTTVSPTYAKEILTPEYGYGLEHALASLPNKPIGILNGLDQQRFSPSNNPLLLPGYDQSTVTLGKQHFKQALRQKLDLPDNDQPLFSVVGRATRQKGMDLLAEVLDTTNTLYQAQIVVQVGLGTPAVEDILKDIASRHTQSLRVLLGFDDAFSHIIYAASDFLLMPSKYEPCGLTQLIAMRYGTIPVVRRTGGLADTVIDINQSHGRGITFDHYDAPSFYQAIQRGLHLYQDKSALSQLIKHDMAQDFSWDKHISQYIDLYSKVSTASQS